MLAIDIAPIIIAIATLVTALGGVIAILLQNNRQAEAGKIAAGEKIDEAVVELGARFDTYADTNDSNHRKVAGRLQSLKADNDVMFGMIVSLDTKVTTLANRRQDGDHFDELMAVGG